MLARAVSKVPWDVLLKKFKIWSQSQSWNKWEMSQIIEKHFPKISGYCPDGGNHVGIEVFTWYLHGVYLHDGNAHFEGFIDLYLCSGFC